MAYKAKVLVVDDDRDFVEGTKIILENGNFQVLTAFSGQQCLEKVNEEKPDLVILDIMMPEKSGFEVCKELKNSLEYNRIPVIMLTALRQKLSQTTYAQVEGLQLEANDYIDKPVEPKELISRINKLLKRRKT